MSTNPLQTFLYVILALLLFGVLILIHELGHYLFARLFKVTVTEFSIGMGKSIVSKTSKKTGIMYSLRLFPIGGYVSMVGENEESDDPNALSKKPAWQRLIIVAAGATVNLIFGIILMLCLVISTSSEGIATNQIYGYADDANYEITSDEYGITAGDRIIKIGNTRTNNAYDLSYEIMRKGTKPVDVTVLRDGNELVLRDVKFPVISSGGTSFGSMDFTVVAVKASIPNVITHTLQRSMLTVRMVWESLFDLVSGRYGLDAVSGPVGITETIVDATDSAVETKDYSSVIYIAAVICINLGVMNLLPIPALDGGRLFFILIEIIFRRPVPAKIENTIHGMGMYLLLLFMLFISLKDVWGLIF